MFLHFKIMNRYEKSNFLPRVPFQIYTKTYKNSFFTLHDFCNIKNCVQKRKEYFALFNILDTQKEITLPQILTILRLHCPSVSNQRSCINERDRKNEFVLNLFDRDVKLLKTSCNRKLKKRFLP